MLKQNLQQKLQQKLSPQQIQFIKLLQRLHKLVKSDTKALNLLKKKIDTTTGLMNKTWLLDKWNEKAPKR